MTVGSRMNDDRRPSVATPLPTELVRLTECEGGPVLVRGARVVVDVQGVTHPVTRPVVALCRCGSSQRLPWCDGVHKRLGKAPHS